MVPVSVKLTSGGRGGGAGFGGSGRNRNMAVNSRGGRPGGGAGGGAGVGASAFGGASDGFGGAGAGFGGGGTYGFAGAARSLGEGPLGGAGSGAAEESMELPANIFVNCPGAAAEGFDHSGCSGGFSLAGGSGAVRGGAGFAAPDPP
ncbi:MAG: hypothetical protein WD733_22460 [Bryobacterales bacterium]